MIRRILSRLYYWAHRITERQRMRKRLAELEQQLVMHDLDMRLVKHYPKPMQDRMVAYRIRLMKRIETARRFV